MSILIGVGGYVGWQPGAKTSMIIMRPAAEAAPGERCKLRDAPDGSTRVRQVNLKIRSIGRIGRGRMQFLARIF